MQVGLFAIFKILVFVFVIGIMFIASMFWIGTQSQWEASINTNFWWFSSMRLILTFVAGLLFWLVSLIVSLIHWRKQKIEKAHIKELIVIEIVLIFIIALIMQIIVFA